MSSDRANAKKLAIMFILVIALLLVGSSIVEAASIIDKAKDFGKMFEKDGKVGKHFTGKQITNIILITALLIAAQVLFWKGLESNKTSQYAIWIIFFVIAVMSATHIVPDANHFVWEKQPIVKARILAFGCDGMEGTGNTLDIAGLTERYKGCNDDGSYTLNGRGKQGVLKTGTNGAGLPAFFFALISLFVVASVYGEQIGLDDKNKYLKYFLVIYLAVMITNEGFEKSTLVMIGGWTAVVAIYTKIKTHLGDKPAPDYEADKKTGRIRHKLYSTSSLAMGLSFAFVQMTCNLFGSSLLGDNMWNPEDLTGGWILFYLAVGVFISYVGRPLLDSIKRKIEDRIKKMDKKTALDVETLSKGNHPWLSLARDIPGLGFIISKLKKVKKIVGDEEDIETQLKEKADELRKRLMQPRTPENEQKIKEIQQALLDIKKLDAQLNADEYKPWLYDTYR